MRVRAFLRNLFREESYEPYRLLPREKRLCDAGGCLLGAAAAFLFFRNVLGLLLVLPCMLLVRLTAKRKKAAAQKLLLGRELREYLLAVIGLLRSGYALENAMRGAGREMRTMYGEESMICREVGIFKQRLALQIPPEQLWAEMSRRTGLAEAAELAAVFSVAKRQGGNYLPILRAQVEAMDARFTVRGEIETLLSGQKLEYEIMCLVPAGILFYLNLTSPELTAYLYQGSGRLLMLLVLLFYAAAVLWGDRILEKSYGK